MNIDTKNDLYLMIIKYIVCDLIASNDIVCHYILALHN